MTLLNDTAAYTLVGTGVTAPLAYLSNRFASRRASVSGTLVLALRNAQRSRFLLDLRTPDHGRLVSEPVADDDIRMLVSDHSQRLEVDADSCGAD